MSSRLSLSHFRHTYLITCIDTWLGTNAFFFFFFFSVLKKRKAFNKGKWWILPKGEEPYQKVTKGGFDFYKFQEQTGNVYGIPKFRIPYTSSDAWWCWCGQWPHAHTHTAFILTWLLWCYKLEIEIIMLAKLLLVKANNVLSE